MIVRHIYDVVEESGSWHVTRDGEPIRNYVYRASGLARDAAARLATANNLWVTIFEIETPLAATLSDTPWPFGATCTNTGTPDKPEWTLTEPYRDDEDATRIIHPDPTGYVQVMVYTRDVYERACMILRIEPADDDDIAEEFCDIAHGHTIPDDIDPFEAVKIRLAYRRSSGIMIEHKIEQDRRADQIEAAGLMIDTYTRDQYEQACEIMGVPVLSDHQVRMIVTIGIVAELGISVTSPDVPDDYISANLAQRRAIGLARERTQADANADAGGEESTGDDAPDTTT